VALVVGKRNSSVGYFKKSSCLSAKLSSTNLTWNGLLWEKELNGDRPAPKRLMYGVAFNVMGFPVVGRLE